MSEKTVKTIAFNGTKDGYPMWEFKKRAFLREIECADTLMRKDMKAEVTDVDEKNRTYKAKSQLQWQWERNNIPNVTLNGQCT
jgi:glutaredoxin